MALTTDVATLVRGTDTCVIQIDIETNTVYAVVTKADGHVDSGSKGSRESLRQATNLAKKEAEALERDGWSLSKANWTQAADDVIDSFDDLGPKSESEKKDDAEPDYLKLGPADLVRRAKKDAEKLAEHRTLDDIGIAFLRRGPTASSGR